jgi:diguanylate cyclase (GGDEF)-like protein/PAS domain S-box-containing protein
MGDVGALLMPDLKPLDSAMPMRTSPDSGTVEIDSQAASNLSALIESTEDLIWSVDLDYRLIAFNRALRQNIEDTLGVRLEAGMRLHELFPADRAALWPPFFERVLHQGPFRVEYSLILHRTLELSFNPIVINGRTTGVSIFGKDITERKAAENALEEAEKRYRAIFDGALEGMFQTSAEGRLISANPSLASMLGYDSPEELMSLAGNVAQDVWADLDDRFRMLRQLEEQGAARDFECRLKRKDWTILWVSLSARSVCGVDGGMLYLEGFIEDISERRRAEDALRESEEFLRESQSIAGLGSYVLDIPKGLWTSSEVLDAIFGIGPGFERSLEGWAALIHPDERATMAAYFAEEVARKGQTFDKEYRIVRQTDGAERWVHGLGRLDFSGQGQPVRMHGTIKDITERKHAEMQLSQSEERYRATYEQAAVGIVHTSFEGRILRCNARFAEIIGYPREEIPGTTFQQITAPEDLAASLDTLHRMSQEAAGSATWEKRYLRKDGSLTWVKITVSVQRDATGRALHSVALVEDINARKTAEERLAATQEALLRSEERHRVAFQTSANAVNIVRLNDGMYLDANEAFLSVTGYERDEVIGRTARELNIFANPDDLLTVAESLRGYSIIRGEFQFRKKSGALIWGLMSASPFEHDGVSCALCVTQDISETKAAAERLAAAQEALWASEERYRTAFETSPDAVVITRKSDGVVLDANQSFFDSAGFERDEVIGRTTSELGIWVNESDLRIYIDQMQRQGKCRDLEVLSRRKNGEVFWMRLSASSIEIGGEQCRISFAKEVTEFKAAEGRMEAAREALRVSEERYRVAFQTSLDGININRLSDGLYIECNKAFLDITGYEREEVIGRTSLELGIWADHRNRHRLVEILRQNTSCRELEVQFRKKSGEVFWVVVSASLIELDGETCILSMVRDISAAKAAEDQIRNLAFYDSLTGLPNRRLLLERLRQILAFSAPHRRRHALLLVNLDNFKMLNETIGHQSGDLLLQETARRLVFCVGGGRTVSRLEGDEFVVILDDLNATAEEAASQAKSAATEILTAIGQPYLLAGRACRCTASTGITVFGDGPETAEEILQQADIALDQARTAGRNTIHFFAPALQAAVNARAELEEDLHQTIKTNEFVLYYQPQVNRGQLIGAEALIRWNHPRRGFLAPGEFIPLAEQTGLILPLGDWVLETACKQIAALANRASTAHVVISVNISSRQFRQPDFVQRVLDALERTGANPRNLELELTESMLAENIEEIIAKMTELKAHGLRFSLDDFGTGYSSLAYLRRLPLDVLKIDRSFVRDILVDAGSGAIAQTILSLSKAMGLPVIAEGVETEEQREFLTRMGCHSFQGFLFSRPLPLEEFERLWLASATGPAPILQ